MAKVETSDIVRQFPDSRAYKMRQSAKELADKTISQVTHEYDLAKDRWNVTLIMESGRRVSYLSPNKILVPR